MRALQRRAAGAVISMHLGCERAAELVAHAAHRLHAPCTPQVAMSRSICLAALVLLALAASASAQCIECSQCKGSGYCLSVCKRSCSPAVNAET